MTQQAVSKNRDENAPAVRGRPFPPGNNANPKGRPRKGNALRDIVRKLSVKDKREVVEIALQEIRENHDVAWATWLLKAEGMSPDRDGGDTYHIAQAMLVRYVEGDGQ